MAGTPAGSGVRGGGRRPPLLALGRPTTAPAIVNTAYVIHGPTPCSLPVLPFPLLGTGAGSPPVSFFGFIVKVWKQESPHTLWTRLLPRQTARQTRIGNLLSSLRPPLLPTQQNRNKPTVAVEAAAGTHWCIIERVNILFHLAWCWQGTSSWHYLMEHGPVCMYTQDEKVNWQTPVPPGTRIFSLSGTKEPKEFCTFQKKSGLA